MITGRHHFVRFLLLTLLLLCTAPAGHAQQRIGVIMTGDIEYYRAMHEVFVEGLKGSQAEIILQRPFPDSIAWSNAARKLIALDVDLIVAYGSPAAQAVLHERSNIPVVYAGVYDPENAVLAGGKVTGCGFKVPLSSLLRYFRRLKEINSFSVIFSSLEEDSVRQRKELQVLAQQQNIKVSEYDIRSRKDVEQLRDSGNDDAVFITGSALAHLWIDDILAIAHEERHPTADIFPDPLEAGVLITLYPPPQAQGKRAAEMVKAILAGARPTDIEPELFRETELVFNLVAAEYIGIKFPIQLIVEATRVIK